ncbi:MAG: dihydrodipicolinate synthase family protein [Clostridiales bacterium]|nr:dihydrodipicolinate synthase family protein [Clostridiales bacterium]
MAKRLSGVFAALTTPFAGEKVALDKLGENLLKYNQTGLAGYVVLGSTGEAVFLSDKEGEELVIEARKKAPPSKKIIVGTSRESTRATIEFTNRIAGLGADAALIKPPYYYKSMMTHEVLKRYYFSIADRVGIPVLIYNFPQNTGIPISPPLLVELSGHPNIAGIKDSSGNLSNLAESLPLLPEKFSFFMGHGSILLAGLVMGACGGILAMAAAIPDLCVKLYSLFVEGKNAEAKKLQLDLVPLNKLLTQTLGIPAIKHALDLRGFYGGPPRPPLLPLEEKEKQDVRDELERLGLLSC